MDWQPVTDEELKAFVAKFGCPVLSRIERVAGDGSPARRRRPSEIELVK